jgi:hypothetical protein
LNKCESDILILGSSRALHHYDTRIVTKLTGMQCYNAGENGMDILFHNLTLKSILKRYNPKIIILDLNVSEFREVQTSYDRLSWLLPFYKTHKDFAPVLLRRSKTEKLKLLSQIYPFNSSILQIIYGVLPIKHTKSEDINGYVPLLGKWSKSIELRRNKNQYTVDTFKVKMFEEILSLAGKHNVNLIVCVSPSFIKYDLSDKSLVLAKSICTRYNVPFFELTENTLFTTRPDLFKDPEHLNYLGAQDFTAKIFNDIRRENADLFNIKKIE